MRMKHAWTSLICSGALIAACTTVAVSANEPTPVGRWKSIDDETGQPKSLVEITEIDGMLHGKVIKIFTPSKPNPTCDKCEGERKGQPITGMEVVWGLKKDGDQWSGGKVLDPKKGKIYDLALSLDDGGRKLKVRGYIGVAMLGRTQVWLREDSALAASGASPTR